MSTKGRLLFFTKNINKAGGQRGVQKYFQNNKDDLNMSITCITFDAEADGAVVGGARVVCVCGDDRDHGRVHRRVLGQGDTAERHRHT